MKAIHQILLSIAIVTSLTLTVMTAHGQIATDGTVGSAQSLTGPNYAIGAGLGTQRGANLFHSFSTFNIHTGESATFSGPSGLQNVISRVTGGNISNIDGMLRSEISGANFFFINPAGVLFGANARLDVPAAFHISTADELRFADGAVFSASNPAVSTLSSEPVAAFGFTSAAPKRIEVNGSFLIIEEGQTLSLIGGDINLTNATIYAPAGRLNVASVGSTGEVAPTETDLELRGFGTLGTLTMVHDWEYRGVVSPGKQYPVFPLGDLDIGGAGGGAMFIRGGNWFNQGGWVIATNWGDRDGSGINAAFRGAVRLENGARLTADTIGRGGGAGGNINLSIADTLTIQNGSQIRTSAWAAGNAGNVTIHARNLLVDRQGYTGFTDVFGNLISGFTGIASDVQSGSTGAGGAVNLTLAETLTVQNGGEISSSTFGAGNAGNVTISARNLLVDNQGYTGFTGISGQANENSTGAGGALNLTLAETLTVQNGGEINVSTFGAGNAGNVTISARNLLVDGQGYTPLFRGFTGIASNVLSGSTGAGGAVNLTLAETLTIQNGGLILANTNGAGNGGKMTIRARNLLVDGQGLTRGYTGIRTETFSTGAGGEVNLTLAETLTVQNGGEISASSFGAGNGGKVTISARNLLVDRQGSTELTGIRSENRYSTGAGGEVNLTVADTLTLRNGGEISASTFAQGRAGTVTILAGNLLVDSQGYTKWLTGIASSALPDSTGAGGSINLDIADTLTVQNGGQIVANTRGAGNAGNVTISAGRAVSIAGGFEVDGNFYPSGLFVSATSTGQAGNLTVTTPNLTLAAGGGIYAYSNQTTGGNLFINADHTLLRNGGVIDSSVYGDSLTEGGNITVNGDTLVILDSPGITAQAQQGKGGNILVNTEAFLYDAASIDDVLNASSESTVTGNQGSVTVNTAIDPGGSIVGLSRRQGDLNDANQDPCARRKGQKKSTLAQVGRGGLPADNRPEGMTVSLGGGDWTPPAEAMESAPSTQEPLALNADWEDCRL